MKILNSNDLINAVNGCNTLSDLFYQIDIFVKNNIYYKNEKLKKSIMQRLKYLCQKENNPPCIAQLHNILFGRGCVYDSFSYELYELYINYIIGKGNIRENLFPFEDFSFLTFILSLDIDIYLDSNNALLKDYCNTNIWKLLSYISKINDKYSDTNLEGYLKQYSKFISCDLLFNSIKKVDYSIFINSIQESCGYFNDKDIYIKFLKQNYKIIEDLYNYPEKKYEFINKIIFFYKKYRELFYDIDKLGQIYEKKYCGIRWYIDMIYGSFVNFPFDKPIETIKIPLECTVRNLTLNIKNDALGFIHNYGNIDASYKIPEEYEISIIINSVIGSLLKFKSYSNIEKEGKIEKIVNETCFKLQKEKNNDFVLESVQIDSLESALEAYKKYSGKIQRGQNRIYKAYKTYKINEDKIDSQATKAVDYLKKMVIGDKRKEIIEGRKFTPIGLLKKLLGGYVVFSINPIVGALTLITRRALNKKTTIAEKKKIIMELETELKLLDEKVDDAKSAGDNKAKYALMRTRSEVANALKKIQYGIEADEKSVSSVKKILK